MSEKAAIAEIAEAFRGYKEGIIGIGLVLGSSIGVSVGVVFGVATDNVGLWISMAAAIGGGVGLAIGAVFFAALSAQETE